MLTPADNEAGEKEKHEKDAPDDAHDDVEHRRPASGFTPDVSSFPPDRQGQDAGLVGSPRDGSEVTTEVGFAIDASLLPRNAFQSNGILTVGISKWLQERTGGRGGATARR